jgi:hypothetical protein
MRVLVGLLLLASLAPAGDRGGLMRAAGIWCACARVKCRLCGRRLDPPAYCAARVTEMARWGDIVRWRITLRFTTETSTEVEGCYRLQLPLLAAYGGGLAHRGVTLPARLRPSLRTRVRYLSQIPRRKDPLLVLRRGPGTLDVRVFPVARHRPAHVTLSAYALARYRGPFEDVRLYRTGRRFLAVVAARPAGKEPADFIDTARGRYLYFLTRKECRARFGDRPVRTVPCVPHLETAVTGRGNEAASHWVALAAFPRGARLPGHEFFAAVP